MTTMKTYLYKQCDNDMTMKTYLYKQRDNDDHNDETYLYKHCDDNNENVPVQTLWWRQRWKRTCINTVNMMTTKTVVWNKFLCGIVSSSSSATRQNATAPRSPPYD